MRRFIARFAKAERGLAFIEFALVAPFIMLILFGGIELTRYMLIVQKVDKTAYAMADLVAQYTPATAARRNGEISVNEMNNVVFRQFPALMAPHDAMNSGSIIVSSIRRERDTIRIKWQIATPGGYSDAQTTSIVSGLSAGAVNASGAALRDRTASFTGDTAVEMSNMLGYENMIISEVFFRYRPILSGILSNLRIPFQLGETTVARRVFSRPRNGNMICLPPTFTYDECTTRTSVNGTAAGCTASTGANSCMDECGGCRANTREWCRATGTAVLMRCTNGNATNQNIAGACDGTGTLSCN